MNDTIKSTVGTKDGRTRNYATVVYPESAPENWLDIVREAKIPVFVSPLHEFDTNPTGEHKKPHYHVIVAYENKKNPEQAREFFESFGGVGCEIVQSLRGYARYLCHLDNPEKHQYSPDDVLSFGGADYIGTIGLPIDKYKSISEMIDFCIEQSIYCYADLLEYAKNERFDWFRVLCDNGTVVIKEYLKSLSWKMDRMYLNKGSLGYNSQSPEGMIAENLEYLGESIERSSD